MQYVLFPSYSNTFGSSIKSRSFSAGSGFRFGFNGKEKQDEIWGDDYDFGARIYDGRLGRWFSVDPLLQKYLSVSPFNLNNNNPLIFKDPDGREIKIATEVISGKTLITITITGKLINESSAVFTQEQLKSYADRIAASFVSTYSGSDGNVIWKANANITVATGDNKLNKTDHALRIVDDGKIPNDKGGFKSTNTYGSASYGENIIYLSKDILDEKPTEEGEYAYSGKTETGYGTLERTSSHEIGHSGDLKHPSKNTLDGNLMHQSKEKNAGMKLTKHQIQKMATSFKMGKLNRGKQKIG